MMTDKTSGLGPTSFAAIVWVGSISALAYATYPGASPAPASQTSLYQPASVVGPPPIVERGVTLIPDDKTVDFIVRFHDGVDAVEACLETPRSELATAQGIFANWAATEPALSQMSLKQVKYSGEFLLTWNTGLKRPLIRTEVQTKLEEVQAMPSVRYADVDLTVQHQRKTR